MHPAHYHAEEDDKTMFFIITDKLGLVDAYSLEVMLAVQSVFNVSTLGMDGP